MADIPEQAGISIGEQPNMAAVVESLRGLSIRASRVVNVPAFDRSDEIVGLLQQINQRLTVVEQRVEALRQDMNVNFSRIERNGIARIINNSIAGGNTPLEPFYGLNGQLIPDFPKTARQAMSLKSKRVNGLLLALGLDTVGVLEVRRNRLMKYIGLRYF
ncbi:hypothetical protein HOY80DRAFT_1095097 [Tuber brumale]|nr:hypothetical protein HOY80DRAFT_1095097 [Tuber brumale]